MDRQKLDALRQLAESGNAEAQFEFGLMYCNGRAGTKNLRTAVNWFEKAAAQNHSGAQLNLGDAHSLGLGATRDRRKAFQLYEKAAVRGHAIAQLRLGEMYASSRFVDKDMCKRGRVV